MPQIDKFALEIALESVGWTKVKLSKATNISPSTITRMIRGKSSAKTFKTHLDTIVAKINQQLTQQNPQSSRLECQDLLADVTPATGGLANTHGNGPPTVDFTLFGEPTSDQVAEYDAKLARKAGKCDLNRSIVDIEAELLRNQNSSFDNRDQQPVLSISYELRRLLLYKNTTVAQELKRIYPRNDHHCRLYVERKIDEQFSQFIGQSQQQIFAFANNSGAGKSTFLARTAYEMARRGHIVFFFNGSQIAVDTDEAELLPQTIRSTLYDPSSHILPKEAVDLLFHPDGSVNFANLREYVRLQNHRQTEVFFFIDALDRAATSKPGKLRRVTELLLRQLSDGGDYPCRIVLSCRSEVWKNRQIATLFAIEGNEFHDQTFFSKDQLPGTQLRFGSANLEGQTGKHASSFDFNEGWFSRATFERAFARFQAYHNLKFDDATKFQDDNFDLLREPLMLRIFFEGGASRDRDSIVKGGAYRRWELMEDYVIEKRREIRVAFDKLSMKVNQHPEFGEHVNSLITSIILCFSIELFCRQVNSIKRNEAKACIGDWLDQLIRAAAQQHRQETAAANKIEFQRVLDNVLPYRLRTPPGVEFLAWLGEELPNRDREQLIDQLIQAGLDIGLLSMESEQIRFSLDLYFEFCLGRALGNNILAGVQSPESILLALFFAPRLRAGETASVDSKVVGGTLSPLYTNQFMANTLRFCILQIEGHARDKEELKLTVDCLSFLSNREFEFQKLACQVVADFALFSKSFRSIRSSIRPESHLAQYPDFDRLLKEQMKLVIAKCLVPISNHGDFVCRFALRQAIMTLRKADARLADLQLGDWIEIDVDRDSAAPRDKSPTTELLRAISYIDALGNSKNADDLDILIDCLTIDIGTKESELRFWIRRMAAVSTVQFIRENRRVPTSDVSVIDNLVLLKVEDIFKEAIGRSVHAFEQAMLSEQYVMLMQVTGNSSFGWLKSKLSSTDNPWQCISVIFALINVQNRLGVLDDTQVDSPKVLWRASFRELLEFAANLEFPKLHIDSFFELIFERLQRGLKTILTSGTGKVTEDQLFAGQSAQAISRDKVQILFSPEFFSTYFDNQHECKERVYALLDHFHQLDKLGTDLQDTFEYVEPARLDAQLLFDFDPDLGMPIHEESYVEKVRGLSQYLESKDAARIESQHLQVDIRPGSWGSALRSAGSVTAAVRAATENESGVAVCFNRPPGHLATNQICIFNNVAAGVRQAQRDYQKKHRRRLRGKPPRVTVLDIDAHHGLNLQQCFYSDPRVHYVSIHQENIHPGEGFVWQAGNDREYKGEVFQGAGGVVNFPVPEEADPSFSKWFATCELREHLDLHQPEILFIACGADADFRDPFAQLNFDPESYFDYGQTIRHWKLALNKPGNEIPVVVAFEGGFGVTNGGLHEPFEALIRGLLGLKLTDTLGSQKPIHQTDKPETRDPIRSILCERMPVDADVADPFQLRLHGDVSQILASGIREPDCQPFLLEPLQFGLGAGTIETQAIDSIGELLVCHGKGLVQCPSTQQIQTSPQVNAPFFVGWRGFPTFWLRLRTWRPINFPQLLRAVYRAYDTPASTIGLIGAIRATSAVSILEKRLRLSPTQTNWNRLPGEMTRQASSILDVPIREHYFESGTEPAEPFDDTLWITGVAARRGPQFSSECMQDADMPRCFYNSKGSNQRMPEASQHHVHFSLLRGSELDNIWKRQGAPLRPQTIRPLLDEIGRKTVMVSHLENVILHDAYIGICPLLVPAAEPDPSLA